MLAQVGVVAEHDLGDRHEDQQQRERRDERVVGEHGDEVAGLVVAELLDDREQDRRRPAPLLPRVDRPQRPVERIVHRTLPAARFLRTAQTRSTRSATESTTADGRYGKRCDVLPPGRPRQHEIGPQPRLHARHDVGVHPVADHRRRLRVRTQGVHRRAEHHRVGLADDVGLGARRLRDERGHRAAGGQGSLCRGTRRVGVGRDEAGAGVDQADGPRDGLERVGPGLPEDDVVGSGVGQHVTDLVQRRGQPRLADDVGGPAGRLVVEELRGGQRGRPDRRFRHVQAGRREARPQVAGREDRVVREHEEPPAPLPQPGEELDGSAECGAFVDEHPVHVRQPAVDGVIRHDPCLHRRAAGGGERVHGPLAAAGSHQLTRSRAVNATES